MVACVHRVAEKGPRSTFRRLAETGDCAAALDYFERKFLIVIGQSSHAPVTVWQALSRETFGSAA